MGARAPPGAGHTPRAGRPQRPTHRRGTLISHAPSLQELQRKAAQSPRSAVLLRSHHSDSHRTSGLGPRRACPGLPGKPPPSEPPGVRSRTPTLHGQRHTHGWGRLPSSGESLRGQVPEPSDPKPPCPTGPVKLPIYAPNQALSGKLVKNKHRKLPVCTDCRGRADEPPDSHLLHPNALHTRAHELPTAD